jgi:hypothetical protein
VAWNVLSGAGLSASSVQATTEAAPTLSTDGIGLVGVDAVKPVLTAPNGQTFDGTGTIKGYFYSRLLGRWVEDPRAEDTLTDLLGKNEGTLPAIPVQTQGGRFAVVCSGVGLSGGSTITVTLIATSRRYGGEI